MIEIKLLLEDTIGNKLEQTLTNERDIMDPVLHDEIDAYISEYIKRFNEENLKRNISLKSLKMYYNDGIKDNEIRNITKNDE